MKLNLANLIGIVVCVLLFLLITAVLYPVFAKVNPASKISICQSNLVTIGRELNMYLSDWDDHYPANRVWSKTKGRLGSIEESVKLTPIGLNDAKGLPVRFLYGVNWVESLHNYAESPSSSANPAPAWQCPYAASGTYPANSKTAYTSYVFNRNLIEIPEMAISNTANLMLVREMDKCVNAELRPVNCSTANPKEMPRSAFLTNKDRKYGATNPGIHKAGFFSKGSLILFADGHAVFLNTSYFPNQPEWDVKTKRWYNFCNTGSAKDKSIAITP